MTIKSLSPLNRLGFSRMRWAILAFPFVATVMNYVDRLAFNYLAAEGSLRDLIPNDYFGYISTAFFVSYMVSNAFSGFVVLKSTSCCGLDFCTNLKMGLNVFSNKRPFG